MVPLEKVLTEPRSGPAPAVRSRKRRPGCNCQPAAQRAAPVQGRRRDDRQGAGRGCRGARGARRPGRDAQRRGRARVRLAAAKAEVAPADHCRAEGDVGTRPMQRTAAILERATMTLRATTQSEPALEPWVCLHRGHAAVRRSVATKLQVGARADGQRLRGAGRCSPAPRAACMRRVDLADALQLTASGVTRLLDGLEEQGLVRKKACSTDGRVTYADAHEGGAQDARAGLIGPHGHDQGAVRGALHAPGAGAPGGAAGPAAARSAGRKFSCALKLCYS